MTIFKKFKFSLPMTSLPVIWAHDVISDQFKKCPERKHEVEVLPSHHMEYQKYHNCCQFLSSIYLPNNGEFIYNI